VVVQVTRRSEKLPQVKHKEWDRRNDATAKRRRLQAAEAYPDEDESEEEDPLQMGQQR